jgi:hypothetical protein
MAAATIPASTWPRLWASPARQLQVGGRGTKATASAALQSGPGGIKADVQQELVTNERVAAHTASPLSCRPPGRAGGPARACQTSGKTEAITGDTAPAPSPHSPGTPAHHVALVSAGPSLAVPGWAKVPRQADLRTYPPIGSGGELAAWAIKACLAHEPPWAPCRCPRGGPRARSR